MFTKEVFVANTARDYDMSYNEVMRIYKKNMCNNSKQFYEDLENFINNRSNS